MKPELVQIISWNDFGERSVFSSLLARTEVEKLQTDASARLDFSSFCSATTSDLSKDLSLVRRLGQMG